MSNPFDIIPKDTIRVISKAGNQISRDLRVHLTANDVTIYDIDVVVEEGDFIERDLPASRTERYEILEAHYNQKFQGIIPAHYFCKIRKTTAISTANNSKTVYNLTGNNVRVYHDSQDQSINVVNESNMEIFDLLKQEITSKIDDNGKLLILLEELKGSVGKVSYTEKYSTFIANAANHMTLLSPFIPALTALLTAS